MGWNSGLITTFCLLSLWPGITVQMPANQNVQFQYFQRHSIVYNPLSSYWQQMAFPERAAAATPGRLLPFSPDSKPLKSFSAAFARFKVSLLEDTAASCDDWVWGAYSTSTTVKIYGCLRRNDEDQTPQFLGQRTHMNALLHEVGACPRKFHIPSSTAMGVAIVWHVNPTIFHWWGFRG